MKITAIRTFHFAFDHSSRQLLSVETDTGLTGWGEMSDSCLRDELAVMLARRKDALIGMDPLCIHDCKRIISSLRQPAMSVVRSISILESALDQALWDITAKHLGVPLFKLFGADGTDCYDILMPDLKYIGGPGVVRGMTEALKGMGKGITLHNPSGIIATAHSAHVSAACRSLPLEFPVNAVPYRELLTIPQEPIQNGMYYLSNQPGIGMDLREDAFHQYAFEWIGSRWVRL